MAMETQTAAEPVDPVSLIRTVDVFAPLDTDKPLRLALGGKFDDLKPGTHTRLFFSTHPHYGGPLDENSVRRIIDTGHAATLEQRLAPAALDSLRTELSDYDESLRDLALVIVSEEERIKAELRVRADRVVEFHSRPRDLDPALPELLSRQPLAKDGLTWSEGLPPNGECVLIVLWSEWPGLRKLYDDRTAMIVDRRRRAGRWIEHQFSAHGMEVFQP